jgi:D-glycero-D-manno-heptose 1,7-bisphosphate phosphatase
MEFVDRPDPTREALFLDRDGTLIEHRVGHVRRHEDIAFIPGVLPALRDLSDAGFPIVIISNQSSVSRGMISIEQVVSLHQHVLADIASAGALVDLSFLCPHQPDDECECRKPGLAMYGAAGRELGRELTGSIVVGDAPCDVRAGLAMNARTVLVRTGLGEDSLVELGTGEYQVYESFPDLAARLLTARRR